MGPKVSSSLDQTVRVWDTGSLREKTLSIGGGGVPALSAPVSEKPNEWLAKTDRSTRVLSETPTLESYIVVEVPGSNLLSYARRPHGIFSRTFHEVDNPMSDSMSVASIASGIPQILSVFFVCVNSI